MIGKVSGVQIIHVAFKSPFEDLLPIGMDKRLLSFAIGVLIIATTAIFLIIPSWGASYAQNMAYELHQQRGLLIISVSTPSLCGTMVGQDDLVASLVVENEHRRPIQNVLFVTQDIDSNGMTESIEINANVTLPAADSIEIANKWKPLSSGKHTIEAFLWQMDSSGSASTALIEKQSVVIEVVEKCQ